MDILFSISLGIPNVTPSAKIAIKIIGFLKRLIGETAGCANVSLCTHLNVSRRGERGEGEALTLGALLIEALLTDYLRLDNDIILWLTGHIDDIFLCAAIVPRVTSEGFPNPENRPIGGDVDTVRGEDVVGPRVDVEEVGLGGRGQVTEHKGQEAG